MKENSTAPAIKPVQLTEKAIEEVKNIMENKNIPDGYGLRIGVKGGMGCAGMGFLLGFDKPKEGDISYEVEDIPIHVEKRQTMYLVGLEVDFYEGSDARGFTFINTNSVTQE